MVLPVLSECIGPALYRKRRFEDRRAGMTRLSQTAVRIGGPRLRTDEVTSLSCETELDRSINGVLIIGILREPQSGNAMEWVFRKQGRHGWLESRALWISRDPQSWLSNLAGETPTERTSV